MLMAGTPERRKSQDRASRRTRPRLSSWPDVARSICVLVCPYMESRPDRKSQSAGMHVRPEPETRRRLSGPALRTFFNISTVWELTVHEQRALLGWPATSTFHKYKGGSLGTLSFDTLTR